MQSSSFHPCIILLNAVISLFVHDDRTVDFFAYNLQPLRNVQICTFLVIGSVLV